MDVLAGLLGRKVRGFQQIGNNPISLSRYTYVTDVLPNIDNYMVTDKADGLRAYLVFHNGTIHSVQSSGCSDLSRSSIKDTIFDCELIGDKYYIFDVLMYDGELVVSKCFRDRFKIIEEYVPEHLFIAKKRYMALGPEIYKNSITNMYMLTTSYEKDGLIFTSLNADYYKTLNYKWKPPKMLTIDFLAIRDKSYYRLYVGINADTYNKLGLRMPSNYINQIRSVPELSFINVDRDNYIQNDYFPVPFINSICHDNIYHHVDASSNVDRSSSDDIHGSIIELTWLDGRWVFHRIRTDKNAEMARGVSFGNNYKTAELTYQLCLNPLLFDDLVADYADITKGFYFVKQDDKYEDVRRYNNKVKSQLIKRYKFHDIIDLASGKGQDLFKYVSLRVHNLTLIEIDKSAIDELVQRKYDVLGRMNDEYSNKNGRPNSKNRPSRANLKKRQGTNIKIFNMDLSTNYQSNLSLLQQHSLPDMRSENRVVFCNLAINYLLGNPDALAEFISNLLNNGNEFVFTSLDGIRVQKLLEEHNGHWETGKYMTEYSSETKKKINVLLPCSSMPSEEYLVNLHDLDAVFKRHHLFRVDNGNFDRFEKDIDIQLAGDDRLYCSMYMYAVYKKYRPR
jgi:hypothetical protein